VQVVIGRIAKAHGIAGEVAVEVRTDAPDLRFATGARLDTDPAERGPLTVQRARWHSGRLLVQFAESPDRTAAEGLRGTLLVADSGTSPLIDEDDGYWDHQLAGLRAEDSSGAAIGVVDDVVHSAGGDLLVVLRPDGTEALIPFVRAIVPTVDLDAGRIVVDPPEGLLDL
jgi:16S rRNA processing protein RimM